MGPQNAAKSGDNGRTTHYLIACLLAIMGFLAIQIWNMSDRLARVETNVAHLICATEGLRNECGH